MKCVYLKIWLILILIGSSGLVFGLDDAEKSAIKAIKTNDLQSLKQYLETHPDINCQFSNGKTGLYYAIISDQAKISAFLLNRGANANFIVDGYSNLYWAIQYDRQRIARLLIEFGADVNKLDAKLKTPLIYAAENSNMEMCKILVNRGADLLPENLREKRPIDYVLYDKQSPTYLYLKSMEHMFSRQDSVPSMHDGPYIFWEDDNQVVLTYYEHNQEKRLTRIIEKTIETGSSDTVVSGAGWDKNTYHIQHQYSPAPYKIETPGKIFAVGDIHGKYIALVNLLKKNQIIDSNLRWTFGDGQLVLLGDIFDRGNLVTEAFWFLYELEIQARESGGNVNLLLGNHEIMEMTGDDRYLNDKYRYFTDYTQTYYFQLFERNTVLGRWLRSKNLIAQVNDNLFMHGGISPQFAAYNFSYADINEWVQRYLYSDYRDKKGSPEDIILGAIGPQWYRGYYNYNNNDNVNIKGEVSDTLSIVTQVFVDSYLKSKGLKRMILGHTEQLKIKPSYEGKVIMIDVGFDENGHSAEGLLISGDDIFRCLADGRKEPIE